MAGRKYGNTSGVWSSTDAGGFVFWEALIAMPVLVILLMSVISIFMFCMRTYFYRLADGELIQEVQYAFATVVEDALAGQAIEDGGRQSPGFDIISRQNPLNGEGAMEEKLKESYWLHNKDGLVKLVRGSVDAPITGDHTLAQVTIVEFSAIKDEHCPGVYVLRLTGKSEMTKHEYTMCTAVYLPPL